MTACMLILLAWSAGIPTQVYPPRDIYPVCGECKSAADEWERARTPDPLPGVKTAQYIGRCVGAPTEPEPSRPAEAASGPEPVPPPAVTPPQRKGWAR